VSWRRRRREGEREMGREGQERREERHRERQIGQGRERPRETNMARKRETYRDTERDLGQGRETHKVGKQALYVSCGIPFLVHTLSLLLAPNPTHALVLWNILIPF
jgi:hypothetical protein